MVSWRLFPVYGIIFNGLFKIWYRQGPILTPWWYQKSRSCVCMFEGFLGLNPAKILPSQKYKFWTTRNDSINQAFRSGDMREDPSNWTKFLRDSDFQKDRSPLFYSITWFLLSFYTDVINGCSFYRPCLTFTALTLKGDTVICQLIPLN